MGAATHLKGLHLEVRSSIDWILNSPYLVHHLRAPDHPPLFSKGCFEQESASKDLVEEGEFDIDDDEEDEDEDEEEDKEKYNKDFLRKNKDIFG